MRVTAFKMAAHNMKQLDQQEKKIKRPFRFDEMAAIDGRTEKYLVDFVIEYCDYGRKLLSLIFRTHVSVCMMERLLFVRGGGEGYSRMGCNW